MSASGHGAAAMSGGAGAPAPASRSRLESLLDGPRFSGLPMQTDAAHGRVASNQCSWAATEFVRIGARLAAAAVAGDEPAFRAAYAGALARGSALRAGRGDARLTMGENVDNAGVRVAGAAAAIRAAGIPCRVLLGAARGSGSATSSASGTPPASPGGASRVGTGSGGAPKWAGSGQSQTQQPQQEQQQQQHRRAVSPKPFPRAPPLPPQGASTSVAAPTSRAAGRGHHSRPGSPDSVDSASSDMSFASRVEVTGIVYAPLRPPSAAAAAAAAAPGFDARAGRGQASLPRGAGVPANAAGEDSSLAPAPALAPIATDSGRRRGGTDSESGGSDAEGGLHTAVPGAMPGGGGGGGGGGTSTKGARFAAPTRTPPPSPLVAGTIGGGGRGRGSSAARPPHAPTPAAAAPHHNQRLRVPVGAPTLEGVATASAAAAVAAASGAVLARNLSALAGANDAPGFVQCVLAHGNAPPPAAVATALAACPPGTAPAFAVAVLEEAAAVAPPRSGTASAASSSGSAAARTTITAFGHAPAPSLRDPCEARRGRGPATGGGAPSSRVPTPLASPARACTASAAVTAPTAPCGGNDDAPASCETVKDPLVALCDAVLAALQPPAGCVVGGALAAPALRARVAALAGRACDAAGCHCGLAAAVATAASGALPPPPLPRCAGVQWQRALEPLLQVSGVAAPSTGAAAPTSPVVADAAAGAPPAMLLDAPAAAEGARAHAAHGGVAAAGVPAPHPVAAEDVSRAFAGETARCHGGAPRLALYACAGLMVSLLLILVAAAVWLVLVAPPLPPASAACARSCMRGCLAQGGGDSSSRVGGDTSRASVLALAAWHGLGTAWAVLQVWVGGI